MYSPLLLQGFNFKAEHLPGKLNPSDYPSRHPVQMLKGDETCISEELKCYVNQVIKETDSTISIVELQAENAEDAVISKVMFLIENGKYPKSGEIPNSFVKIWDEHSVVDNILLKQERLVTPWFHPTFQVPPKRVGPP